MRDANVIALHRADRLRWQLPSFQRKLGRAREVIAECLAACARPYCAWSGGKDSLVVLALTAALAPGIPAIWCDDELEYPEQPAYVPATARLLGATPIVVQGWKRHAGWFDPWRAEPFWRPPLPDMQWIARPVDVWADAVGYDGTLLGLRKAESGMRRQYLNAKGRLHGTRAGLRCNPLANWTVDEIWAAIVGLGLPYHPAYDRLTVIGVPREEQRVGPLPLSPASLLHAGWPELYERLTTRYGNRWQG